MTDAELRALAEECVRVDSALVVDPDRILALLDRIEVLEEVAAAARELLGLPLPDKFDGRWAHLVAALAREEASR